MDSDKDDEVFTAQGRDTPGPVESCGAGAGRARPSANDCPEPAVGDQAGVLGKTTGSGSRKAVRGETPSFAKKSFKIPRTPPKSGLVRMGSFSDVERKIGYGRKPLVPEEQKGVKRALITTEHSIEKCARREDMTMRQLLETIRELKSEIDESVIKTGNMVDLIDKIEILATRVETENAIRQTEYAGDGSLGKLRELRGKIARVECYKDVQNLIAEKWPKEAYKTTTLKEGDPLTGEGDLVWFRPPPEGQTDRQERELERRMTRRYPEVEDMTELRWETLTISTTRTNKAGKVESRLVHVGNFEEHTCEARYGQLRSLRDYLLNMNRSTVVFMEGRIERIEWAKTIECAMGESGIRAILYGRKEDGDEDRRRFRNEALLITKPRNVDYADMVRRIREKAQSSGNDLTVRKIRKTRNGDVLLELNEEDNGKALREMVEKVEGAKVRKLEKNDPLMRKYVIRDIDISSSQEEVKEALMAVDSGAGETNDVKIAALRQAYDGTQTAIVELSRSKAEKILEKGGIKIGLTKCKLKEWVEITRCHRCWELGHTQGVCQNEDRRGSCLRCGKVGHQAEICEQPMHCPLCNRDGHRAGSGACPKMRDMLKRLRGKAKPKPGQPRRDINM